MCDTVFVRINPPREIETVGELRAFIGFDPIPKAGREPLDGDRFCLCNVDLPSTAAKAGYVHEVDSVLAVDWWPVSTADSRSDAP